MGDGHYDHPLCPGLQSGPPSQTPGGLGQRYWSVSGVTWPPKSGVSEVGVFMALKPNVSMLIRHHRPHLWNVHLWGNVFADASTESILDFEI